MQPEPVPSEASPISSVIYSSPSGRTFMPPSRGGFFNLRRFASPIFFDLEGLLDLEERTLKPDDLEGFENDLDGLLLERLEPLDLRAFFISTPSCSCFYSGMWISVRFLSSSHHSSSVRSSSLLSQKMSSMGMEHHASPNETATSSMSQYFSMSTPLVMA